MAIALDAVAEKDDNAGSTVSTETWSHTVGTLTNGAIFVLISLSNSSTNRTISGVTYNSVAMTLVTRYTISTSCELTTWELVNPSSGANNVVATFSGSSTVTYFSAGSISLSGVDQTTLHDGTGTSTATNTAFSVGVTTSYDNSWVLSAINSDGSAAFNTTYGAGQTELARQNSDYNEETYSGPLTPAGAKTHTYSSGSSTGANIIALGVKAYVATFNVKPTMLAVF